MQDEQHSNFTLTTKKPKLPEEIESLFSRNYQASPNFFRPHLRPSANPSADPNPSSNIPSQHPQSRWRYIIFSGHPSCISARHSVAAVTGLNPVTLATCRRNSFPTRANRAASPFSRDSVARVRGVWANRRSERGPSTILTRRTDAQK